jgi:DNA-binding NarL/FixJ family response regulator
MRVTLADDSALFRSGLSLLLRSLGVDVLAEAADGLGLLRSVELEQPDVVMLDIRMPPTFTDEGLIAAVELRRRYPTLGILVLSTYAESHYASRLLASGSNGIGYLLKDRVDDPAALRDALSRIAAGGCVIDSEIVTRLFSRQRTKSVLDQLSDKEREVLRSMAEGRSNQGIGQSLYVSSRTVEKHIAAIFTKLGLPTASDENRRVLAVLAWLRAEQSG